MSGPAKPSARPDALAPWAGTIVGPAAFFLCQQGLGSAVYNDCHSGGPPWGPAAAALAVLVIALSGYVSWRAAGPDQTALRRFIGQVGAGLATLCGLAALAIAAAALVIPPCVR